jgi:hypothetical protein
MGVLLPDAGRWRGGHQVRPVGGVSLEDVFEWA